MASVGSPLRELWPGLGLSGKADIQFECDKYPILIPDILDSSDPSMINLPVDRTLKKRGAPMFNYHLENILVSAVKGVIEPSRSAPADR